MNTPRNLFLVTVGTESLHAPRAYLASADASPLKGSELVAEAAHLNASEPAGTTCCHSHDHCDANMTMARAFGRCGYETCCSIPESGEGVDQRQTDSADLWNTAWDMAKAHDFDAARIDAAAGSPASIAA